jgi:hypothetical protein
MAPGDDEIKHERVINLLKQMEKVSAPPGFESDLMRRINLGNYEEKYKLTWWNNLLTPWRLISSAAVVGAAALVLYFFNFSTSDYENPFLVKPKMRIVKTQGVNDQKAPVSRIQYSEASVNGSLKIDKEGLNFLQIRLNDAEKAKINRLKAQIKAYFNK